MTENIEKQHNQPRIFISYAQSDGEDFARKLRRRLIKEYKFNVWQDRTNMEGGKDWWQQIEKALKSKHIEYLVLVMTTNAMRSETVRKEWRLARQEGVCVVPVIASSRPDFKSLPNWMKAVHFVNPDVPEQWDRFILTLKSPCQIQRVPFMVEELPEDFVQRPCEFDQLIANLLENKREQPVAITAALRGAGGYGKTTLARALCHNERVQEIFYDGILWVTLGKEPGDLIEKVNDLIEILSDERPGFKSIESATNHLIEMLANRHMLIVIDDVWNTAHLKPFLQGGVQCSRLITTRNFDTLPANARRIDVDAMQQKEAAALIGSGLPQRNETDLSKLSARLGEWPLLLKLVNGALRDRVYNTGQTLADALVYVNRALDKRGLTFFDARDAAAREQAAGKTLSISFELLYSKERARYNELAIFPEVTDIPLYILEKLWNKTGGFSDFDTEELCDRLRKLSLLLRFDPVTRNIRLHDIVRQYLIFKQKDALPALHDRLLDAYRSSLPASGSAISDWSLLPAKDEYLWKNIAYHLFESGRKDELQKLLFDFKWLAAKLKATDVNSLISDYDFLLKGHDSIKRDNPAYLVRSALRLSAHILTDREQLPSQLTGRLLSFQEPEIKSLLEWVREWKDEMWLRPLTASLTQPGGPLILTMKGHTGWVSAVSVTPDGRRAISASYDNTLKIWDMETGVEIRTLEGHTDAVDAVSVTADGRCAISASYDNTLKIWDMETGVEIRTLEGHTDAVDAVSVTADGRRAISGSDDGTLKVWDMESGKVLCTLKGHTRYVSAVCILPDGKRAISGYSDNTLKVWDMESGGVLKTLKGHTSYIHAVSVLSDGKHAISGSEDGTLKVWDMESGKVLKTLKGHASIVYAVSVLSDGKRAISGSDDGTLKVWDMESGKVLCTLKGHTDPVCAVSILPDGKHAISGSWDNTLKVWGLESGGVLKTLKGHTDRVWTLSLLPDGKRAISGSWDNTLKVWGLESGGVLKTLKGHTSSVNAVSVLPDGKRAISGSVDGTLKVWDLESGKVLKTLKDTSIVEVVSVLPDGKRAISGYQDKTLKVWDLESGEVLKTLKGHNDYVDHVSVLPDGKRAISGSWDNTLKVWDMESGKVLHTLKGHTASVSAVSVLPDGKRAISGSHDKTLKVWDLESGEVLLTLKGHMDWVSAISLLPDGKRAISGSGDSTLKVWDLESGEVLHTLKGHTDSVYAVSVLPDGKRAISGSSDNTLKVWNIENKVAIASFSGDGTLFRITVSQDGKIIIAGESSGKLHFLRLEEGGKIPKTRIERKIACPKCGSDDITFSKKRRLYVCPDCHDEFIVEKKISY